MNAVRSGQEGKGAAGAAEGGPQGMAVTGCHRQYRAPQAAESGTGGGCRVCPRTGSGAQCDPGTGRDPGRETGCDRSAVSQVGAPAGG